MDLHLNNLINISSNKSFKNIPRFLIYTVGVLKQLAINFVIFFFYDYFQDLLSSSYKFVCIWHPIVGDMKYYRSGI